MSARRWLAVVCVGLLAVGSAVSGQARGAEPGTIEALIAEVRGLRAELNQAAGASIHTQLLVARLTLQEQRINTVSKQLADIQMLRTGNDAGVAQMSSRQKQIEDTLRGQMASEIRQQLEREVAGLKGPLNQMRQRSQELLAQESALSGQLASEQSRWMDFNSRLDEIEREIRERR